MVAILRGYLEEADGGADDNLASVERRLPADTTQQQEEELDQELQTQPLLDSVRSKARTAAGILSRYRCCL